MSLLVPDVIIDSIYDIDAGALARRGIKLLLADLDNTLARYRQAEPAPEVFLWRDQLAGHGIALFVLSNSRLRYRAPRFCSALGVPFIAYAGKPRRRNFLAAMERMGASPSETAMVGDQMFTDVLGARRAGVFSILVHPINRNSLFCKVLYTIEGPFRRAAGKK